MIGGRRGLHNFPKTCSLTLKKNGEQIMYYPAHMSLGMEQTEKMEAKNLHGGNTDMVCWVLISQCNLTGMVGSDCQRHSEALESKMPSAEL